MVSGLGPVTTECIPDDKFRFHWTWVDLIFKVRASSFKVGKS